ncbi:MAG: hypothetical protein JNM85_05675 [Chthonomonas sp.]|nr:hypothetical protein [Chthonomonas sp.]
MKNFVKTFAAFVAILGVVAGAFAQNSGPRGGPGGPGKKGDGQHRMMLGKKENEMLAKLNLTAEQKSKVKALQDVRDRTFKKLMSDRDPSKREETGNKMREAMKRYETALDKILTPAQRTKLTQLREAAKKEMEKRRGEKGSKPTPKP